MCVCYCRLELCNAEMLPEVEKLLSDEMGGVRCSALTALTDLIPLVDKSMCIYIDAYIHVYIRMYVCTRT